MGNVKCILQVYSDLQLITWNLDSLSSTCSKYTKSLTVRSKNPATYFSIAVQIFDLQSSIKSRVMQLYSLRGERILAYPRTLLKTHLGLN